MNSTVSATDATADADGHSTRQIDFLSLEAELDNTSWIIPIFKQALDDIHQSLRQAFYTDENIEDLIHRRSDQIDRILQLAWKRFSWNENLKSWRKSRISLLAVGGYGRGELHPHSDIDLMVLLERDSYDTHTQNIQSFLALLWDIGLEVGHSVRSAKECYVQAKANITVVTSLMESRTIIGSEELRQKMLERISPRKIWSSKKFFKAKWNEQLERHEKYDHTEYNLEPNVKRSPGGLRDIQMVMWVARRQYDVKKYGDLISFGFITPEECQLLEEGRRFMWRIRYGLHLNSGRNDDRLSFDHQRSLAQLFGYRDADTLLAVEQFMKDYYRTALELRDVNELLLQHFDEDILRAGERAKVRSLNERFQIRNDYIEVKDPNIFAKDPASLLEIFVLIGIHDIQGVRASTIRLLQKHALTIDDSFRNNPKVSAMFLALLRSPQRLFTPLRQMKRWGILGAYLPEFGKVIGQMQFDLFHIYTVDAHTLQVIRNMRRFRYRNNEQRFPIAAHIFPRLPKVELLYISGLYHDIAKGRGGDHSTLGVADAANFCKRHGLSTWDTNLVCWLVKNHLVMSVTAQRKDISDPDIIVEFALLVQDQVRLDYLYCLTVADITATNPTLWNSWRASLMRQLYVETKRALRRGLEKYADKAAYIEEHQTAALDRLTSHGIAKGESLRIWDNIGDEYFVRETVSDIVWHTEAISRHVSTGPLVIMRDYLMRFGDEGATQIFLHMHDADYLFSATVNALDYLGLDVVDARIYTSASRLVFNTFVVLDAEGHPVGNDKSRIKEIRSTLAEYLNQPDKYSKYVRRRTPQSLRQFNIPTEVTISTDPNNQLTVVEVVTTDRPGLLSLIGRALAESGVNIKNAKIATLGERVEDVFFVLDRDGHLISDPEVCQAIENSIRFQLDHHFNP